MFCIKYVYIIFISFLACEKLFVFSIKINGEKKAILALLFTFLLFFIYKYCKILIVPLIYLLCVIANKLFYKNTTVKSFILTIYSISIAFGVIPLVQW